MLTQRNFRYEIQSDTTYTFLKAKYKKQGEAATNFGPTWPEVAGFGEAPQQAVFCILTVRQNAKNPQVYIYLNCLPF